MHQNNSTRLSFLGLLLVVAVAGAAGGAILLGGFTAAPLTQTPAGVADAAYTAKILKALAAIIVEWIILMPGMALLIGAFSLSQLGALSRLAQPGQGHPEPQPALETQRETVRTLIAHTRRTNPEGDMERLEIDAASHPFDAGRARRVELARIRKVQQMLFAAGAAASFALPILTLAAAMTLL